MSIKELDMYDSNPPLLSEKVQAQLYTLLTEIAGKSLEDFQPTHVKGSFPMPGPSYIYKVEGRIEFAKELLAKFYNIHKTSIVKTIEW